MGILRPSENGFSDGLTSFPALAGNLPVYCPPPQPVLRFFTDNPFILILNENVYKENPMNRRQFIGGTAAVSLAAAASFAHARNHHRHQGAHASASAGAYEAARKAAARCVETGQICLAHCISLLSKGDTGMKDCAVNVNQMLALCGSLQNLAAQNAPLVPALAKVCLEACRQCAAACKVHAGHHAECKACYESCLACIKECEKIAA